MWRLLVVCLALLPAFATADPVFKVIPRDEDFSGQPLADLLKRLQSNRDRLSNFLGIPPSTVQIQVEVFSALAAKALATQNMQPAHADPLSRTLYLVQNDFWDGVSLHVENEFLIAEIIGKSGSRLLEKGLATWLVPNWQEKGFLYWAHRIVASHNLPPLTVLLDNDRFQAGSPLVHTALAGAFVSFLLDTRGKQQLLDYYKTPEALFDQAPSLEKEFHNYLMDCFPSEKTEPVPLDKGYWKGFNFAHEGYQIYNGYGSNLAKQSLEHMATTGSNAVAIVPYTFMRDPQLPVPLPFPQRAGSENDAAVLEAAFQARVLGMKTLLKPQIWLRNSWPGDIRMSNPTGWQQFMDYYRQWITHYALLAEMYDFDAFCVGVELVQSTQNQPDQWRQLIRDIRILYSGSVTYAANWGTEFEQLSFWDELDYIGLDCYYPLGKETPTSVAALSRTFRQVCQKIENISCQFNKPVLLTEIGFRSVTQPWVHPYAEPMGRPANQQHQMMCYQAVLQELQNQSWCTGILWWKWPSYLDYGGSDNTGFSPANKLAEQPLQQGFAQLPH